jgi:alkylation response protein AidB-like acyl-CoA dehydrogenase
VTVDYNVDFRDVKFQIFDWLPTERLLGHGLFADWDRENLEMVLAEALKISQEEIAASNEDGDRQGCVLEDGRVRVPASFKAPYKTVAEGGWIGCTNNPEFGGLGVPVVVGTAVNEFFSGANLSMALVLMLTRGASELIEDFGSDEMRSLFCEKLYSGEWTGTMCLTEPQAGSDVGASTTRAQLQDNGRYLISGEKIFITYGDHDLTENVVHAVLARLPGAPAGTKGLSLFIVPKFRVNPDGSLGEPNDVQCASIEHKMGIHGSPTCSMLFGQQGACEGFLVGEENFGMKLMFTMMNSARVEVGLQGVALAGAAHQAALAYARERVQSRLWSDAGNRDATPVPIVEHPDVRRLLLLSGSYVQGMRALLLQTALYQDMARATGGDEAASYRAFSELLTPVCKAWCTDWSFRVAEWCLQVFGGYGYTRDYPAEQYLRDAKIGSIYEGTNGIQALDLVSRKIPAHDGRPFRELIARVGNTVKNLSGDSKLGGPAMRLSKAVKQLQESVAEVQQRPDAMQSLMLNAVPFLDMVGTTLAGNFLLEQAHLAQARLGELLKASGVDGEDATAVAAVLRADEEAAFYHNKVQAATHFAYRALPMVKALGTAIRAGESAPIVAQL